MAFLTQCQNLQKRKVRKEKTKNRTKTMKTLVMLQNTYLSNPARKLCYRPPTREKINNSVEGVYTKKINKQVEINK